METKTQAQWHVEMDPETDTPRTIYGQFAVADDGAEEICQVETVEQANLIAAAPDLLAACKLFEELTRHGQPPGSEDLEILQAAIARAEGRS